ncbi:hypothetical protein [Sphingobacterium lactis]|uniref:Lipoprotein n=1 Tax=Sphingobacterium lactis TaxID=797291 RepID=A0A1H6CFI6_9SPHI|nr:hypothetical protein [Sphingobacterium lactis]SEG71771.1 hypothetical protein SAMN05421877_11546 [Sphingobacterium lactis]
MKIKSISTYLPFALLFASCVSNNKEQPVSDSTFVDSTNTEYTLSKSDRLEDYLLALDSNDIQSVSKVTAKFNELFPEKDTVQGDKAVGLIIDFMNKLTIFGNRTTFDENQNYSALVDVEFNEGNADIPEELKADYEKINKNGFRVREVEGMPDLEINPFYIQNNFYPYISKNFEIYLQQMAQENKEGFAMDAAIIIPYQYLVQRVIWWEDFAKNAKDPWLKAKADEQYEWYLTNLTIGMDNTPVIEGQQVSPYFKDAYAYLTELAPNSAAYKKLERYINFLNDNKIEDAKALLPTLIGSHMN